jgi:hypothetical protein
MSITDWKALNRHIIDHESELIAEVLADLPVAIAHLQPEVALEATHHGIRRWLVFGVGEATEWLELRMLSLYEVLPFGE